MEGIQILALVLAIPIILFPAAFIWYLNIGGMVHAVREAKVAKEKEAAAVKVVS